MSAGAPPPFRDGTSPIDREELARLLPAGLDAFGTGPSRDGNSPPMDQDAWMAQMMNSLWMNAQQQQQHPNQQQQQFHPQQQQQQHHQQQPPMGSGGHGGGGMPNPQHQHMRGPPGGGYQDHNFMMGGGGAFLPDKQHHEGRGRGGRGRGGRGGGRGGGGRGGYHSEFVPQHPQQHQHQHQHQQQHYGGGGGRGGGNGAGARPYEPEELVEGNGGPNGAHRRGSFAVVEFKRERLKKFPCPTDIPTGEYVIVDGDRGQDCGLVVQTITADVKMEVSSLDGTEVDGVKLKVEQGRVLRVASEVEVQMLHNEIAALERAALKTCRARVKEMGFQFEVIDCEYQFDRKKISFFFDSVHSIDFRDLVKDLYKMFGARIWMENINPGVKNTVPQGALSRHEKVALARAANRRDFTDVSVSARPFYPRARQPIPREVQTQTNGEEGETQQDETM